jgi:hypothetical protein
MHVCCQPRELFTSCCCRQAPGVAKDWPLGMRAGKAPAPMRSSPFSAAGYTPFADTGAGAPPPAPAPAQQSAGFAVRRSGASGSAAGQEGAGGGGGGGGGAAGAVPVPDDGVSEGGKVGTPSPHWGLRLDCAGCRAQPALKCALGF